MCNHGIVCDEIVQENVALDLNADPRRGSRNRPYHCSLAEHFAVLLGGNLRWHFEDHLQMSLPVERLFAFKYQAGAADVLDFSVAPLHRTYAPVLYFRAPGHAPLTRPPGQL